MSYRIRWEGHGIYERFFGILTEEDYATSHNDMCSDIRFASVRYVIADCLEVQPAAEVGDAATAKQAQMARLEYFSTPDVIYAVVAIDEHVRRQASYFKALMRSLYPVGVFSTVAEARAWIAANPRRNHDVKQ